MLIPINLVYNGNMNFEARCTELNYQEILYYLGYRSQGIEDALNQQIQYCISQIQKNMHPTLTYKIVNVNKGCIVDFPVYGKDIQELISKADQVILFCATIGNDVERLILRNEVMNMANALIMDAVASVAIENVCNNFEEDIRKYYSDIYYVSDRFSPGYGDCPISMQKQFCSYLNTEKLMGVHVTDSYIMTPRKSVTAILSLSKQPFERRKSGCEVCRMFMTCSYRKVGKHCGK